MRSRGLIKLWGQPSLSLLLHNPKMPPKRDKDAMVEPQDWIDQSSLHRIQLEPGYITDTTKGAQHLLQYSPHS